MMSGVIDRLGNGDGDGYGYGCGNGDGKSPTMDSQALAKSSSRRSSPLISMNPGRSP